MNLQMTYHRTKRDPRRSPLRNYWSVLISSVVCFVLVVIPSLANAAQDTIPVEPWPEKQAVDFERQVKPLLQKSCLACHNRTDAEGGLDLESVASIMEGSDTGEVITAGSAEESVLLKVASHSMDPVMPPEGNAAAAPNWTSKELGIVAAWIDQGAKESTAEMVVEPKLQPILKKLTPVYALSVTANGRLLVAGYGNRVGVWDIEAQKRIATLVDDSIQSEVQASDPNSSEFAKQFAHLDYVQSIAANLNGSLIATGGYRTVKLWRRDNLAVTANTNLNSQPVIVAVDEPSSLAFVGTALPSIEVWITTTGERLKEFELEAKPLWIECSPSFSLFSLTENGELHCWNSKNPPTGASKESASESSQHPVQLSAELLSQFVKVGTHKLESTPTFVDWLPEINKLVVGYEDGKIELWSTDATAGPSALTTTEPNAVDPSESDAKGNEKEQEYTLLKTNQWQASSQVIQAIWTTVMPDREPSERVICSLDRAGVVSVWSDAAKELIQQNATAISDASVLKLNDSGSIALLDSHGQVFIGSIAEDSKFAALSLSQPKQDRLAYLDQEIAGAGLRQSYFASLVNDSTNAINANSEAISKAMESLQAKQAEVDSQQKVVKTVEEQVVENQRLRDTLPAEIESLNNRLLSMREQAIQFKTQLQQVMESHAGDKLNLQKAKDELAAAAKQTVSLVAAVEKDASEENNSALKNHLANIDAKLQTVEALQILVDVNDKTFEAMKTPAEKVFAELALLEETHAEKTQELTRANESKAELEAKQKTELEKLNQLTAEQVTAEGEHQRFKTEAKYLNERLDRFTQRKDRTDQFLFEQSSELDQLKLESEPVAVSMALGPEGQLLVLSSDGRLFQADAERRLVLSCDTVDAAGSDARLLAADSERAWLLNESELSVVSTLPNWSLVKTIGEIENGLPFSDRILALDFDSTGKRLAIGGGEPSRHGELFVYTFATDELVRIGKEVHVDVINDLRFSPDGDQIATASADRLTKVFDLSTQAQVTFFEGHSHHAQTVAWSQSGKWLATGSADRLVKTWNLVEESPHRTYEPSSKEITALAFIGNNDSFMVASGGAEIRSVNVENGQRNWQGKAGSDFVYALSLSREGKIAASGGQDGQIRVWKQKPESQQWDLIWELQPIDPE